MTSVSPVHVRPRAADELARTRWAWAVAHGAVAIGFVAADVAIGESIDGAPTAGEQRLVDGGAALAIVLIPLGLVLGRSLRRSIWSSAAWRERRLVAVGVGFLAAFVAVTRVPMLLSRLIWHVSLDVDEPLTTVSLTLQVLVSIVVNGALLVFAMAEHRNSSPPHPI